MQFSFKGGNSKKNVFYILQKTSFFIKFPLYIYIYIYIKK